VACCPIGTLSCPGQGRAFDCCVGDERCTGNGCCHPCGQSNCCLQGESCSADGFCVTPE
jgi:hypothetical protein